MEHEYLDLVCGLLDEGRAVSLKVTGYSMRPFIEHRRDTVVLKKSDTFAAGDVVLAKLPTGVYVLHRIESIQDENVVMRGDGNVGLTEHCQISDIKGKMISIMRKGRKWSVDGKFWRAYSFIWTGLLPVRSILLRFYALFNPRKDLYGTRKIENSNINK